MIEPVNDNILNLVNELYNNLDAKDKIINEQALEISQLKERFERLVQEHIDTITRNEEKQQRIDKAKEYIKSNYRDLLLNDPPREAFDINELLGILGDKE